MAVGQGSLISSLSYIGIGREVDSAYGTYTTATAGLSFISAELKTAKETKILEQVETSRTLSKRISLGRVIEGSMEFYVDPKNTAFGYILENAFGGAITTETATGETAGGLGFEHTFQIGNVADLSYTSLCINMRKGDSSGGQIFEYSGARVNEISFSSELDEPLKCSTAVLIKDSSVTSNDIASALVGRQTDCLSFVSGRLSLESTFASLTSTSFWHVQNVEFGIANNLKGDSESRRIGSDTLDVLPMGMAGFTLNFTMRFDTLTAYNAMIAESKFSAQLEFQGDTMTGSVIREGVRFDFPEIYINEPGDPSVGGPDEILTAEVSCSVLRDASSASGYAVQALLTNLVSSYA